MTWWWRRRFFEATLKGATITLGSTMVSCALAIQIEKHTHRLFFFCAPHWYANVEYAYGISESELAVVRQRWGKTVGPTNTTTALAADECTVERSWNEVLPGTCAVFQPEHDERSLTTPTEFPGVREGSVLGQPLDGHDRISSAVSLALGPQDSDFPILPLSFPSLSHDNDSEDPVVSQFGLSETPTTTPSSPQGAGLRLGDVMSHAMTA